MRVRRHGSRLSHQAAGEGLVPIEHLVHEFGSSGHPSEASVRTLTEHRRAVRLARLLSWATGAGSPWRAAGLSLIDHLLPNGCAPVLDAPGFGGLLREALRPEPKRVFDALILANLLDLAARAGGDGVSGEVPLAALPRFSTLFASRSILVRPAPADATDRLALDGETLGVTGPRGWQHIHEVDRREPPTERWARVPLAVVAGFTIDTNDITVPAASVQQLEPIPGQMEVLSASWRLFGRPALVSFARDISAVTTWLVPGPASTVVYGSTSPWMTGRMVASLDHPAVDVGEVLVHENEHSKLAMLLDLTHACGEALLDEPHDPIPSPWRPEPRPAEGLLHGIVASTAVAEYWNAVRVGAPDLEPVAVAQTWLRAEQVRRAHAALHEAGALTQLGTRLVEPMVERADAAAATVPTEADVERVRKDPSRLWF